MTTLRQNFIRELVIRGMAPKTQEAYVRAVRDLASHYHKGPDLITDDQIKDYLVHLAEGKRLARSSVNVAVNGMRCFYSLVLKRDCEHLKGLIPHCQKAIRRPRVYSIEELERLFTVGCVHPKHRAFLMTVYGGGLRLGEACRLRPCHIDSARMQIRVEDGKGHKDRYTLLSSRLLQELRDYYRMFRPKAWQKSHCRRVLASTFSTSRKSGLGCLTKAGSTVCGIALPRTCWSRAWRSPPYSACWVTPASRPLRSTCT
jgi:integrase/recombinase XerD